MVTIGHNILIICNLVTLLIKIIISVVCDLSHKTSQVTSEKKDGNRRIKVSRRECWTFINQHTRLNKYFPFSFLSTQSKPTIFH